MITRAIVSHENDHKSKLQRRSVMNLTCAQLRLIIEGPTWKDCMWLKQRKLVKKKRKPLPCSWQCFLGLISSKERRQSPWHSPATPLGRNIELQRWDWSAVYFVLSQWRDNLSLALEKEHLIIFSSHLADVKVDSFLAQFLAEVTQVEVDQGVHLRQGFLLQCGCEGVGYVLNTHLLSKLEM